MSTAFKEFEDEKEARAFQIWDCGSPLYDSCELVSLSHIIERHMMVCPSYVPGSKQSITHLSYPDEVIISAKGSSKLTSLSELLEKIIMWKRKVTRDQGKGKEQKKIKIGFSGIYCRLLCGGNSILT